jgi:hypothetical protein
MTNSESHNPTSSDRDEPLSLYELKPDDVVKAIFATDVEIEPVKTPKRKRPKN